MKTLVKSLKAHLENSGIKVTDIRYKSHGRVFSIGIDANDSKGNYVTIEPQSNGVYFVVFDSVEPHKYGFNKHHLSSHYSNKRKGYQPILTATIAEMKKEINDLFNIGK